MITPDIKFRFANKNDAESLQRNLFPHKSLERVTKDLQADLDKMEQGQMIRIIGDFNDESISNVQVYYTKNHPLFCHRAEMHTVHVNQDHRRIGIASAMIEYALGKAKTDQVEIVTVWVDGENTPAINLYQKSGFTEYGRLQRGIKKSDRFCDYVLMQKSLLT